jgi:hypothetical protein
MKKVGRRGEVVVVPLSSSGEGTHNRMDQWQRVEVVDDVDVEDHLER